MKLKLTKKSRLSTINFAKLLFGRVFSDHMLICNYKDACWQEPEILPYGPISITPGSQVLHYGQSIFEGMNAFKDSNNDILLFRKEENFNSLNASAKRMSIPLLPEDVFMNGINELLKIDRDWCKAEDGYSLYIRPFIFASAECIKASSSSEFTFMIITSPTMNYYPNSIDLVIEEKFSRAGRGGVGAAKAAGNYAASFYPTKLANAHGFTQVIWTDILEHKYIEECGTMNMWFRINDKLVTPSLSDSILAGITRDSIIKLASVNGIELEERRVSVEEIIDASNQGTLKEVFGSGTAVTIVSVQSITYRNKKLLIPAQSNSFAKSLKKQLQDIQYGRVEDTYKWITMLES